MDKIYLLTVDLIYLDDIITTVTITNLKTNLILGMYIIILKICPPDFVNQNLHKLIHQLISNSYLKSLFDTLLFLPIKMLLLLKILFKTQTKINFQKVNSNNNKLTFKYTSVQYKNKFTDCDYKYIG